MPNGSLDYNLFKGQSHFTCTIRFKISQGLALVLFYQHEESEQLLYYVGFQFQCQTWGFLLARLVDHDKGSQTTVLVGTIGCRALECVTTGKASKETYTHSFSVEALKITYRRKPIDPKAEEHQVNIVDWVWKLYKMENFSDAVDHRLSS